MSNQSQFDGLGYEFYALYYDEDQVKDDKEANETDEDPSTDITSGCVGHESGEAD